MISKLILGTVQFGLRYGIANTHGQSSFQDVCRILKTAVAGGIKTLDTASAYGESESVLGKALRDLNLSGKIDIVSKVSPLPDDLPESKAEAFIRDSLIRSLKNLHQDHLHTLLFHREKDWKYAEILKKIKEDGLILHYGCSIDGRVPENCSLLEAVQVPGNLLDRRFFPFIKAVHRRNVHVYVRSVYLQGLLLMPEEKFNPFLQPLIPYIRKLSKLADEAGMPLAELCVRYLCSMPEIDGVLTGVETQEQLEYNLKLAEKDAIESDLRRKIEETVPELPEELIRPSLWKKTGETK